MAVKLSRKSGQFTLLLAEVKWLDISGLAPKLASALRVTKSDAVRALRLQRGILLEGLSEEQALAAQSALQAEGVQTRVTPDAEVPALSKPLEVSLIRVGDHDFETPSVVGAGLPQLWPWENLALACGGIILDGAVQAEKLSVALEQGLHEEADVRKAHAQRQLEKARERVFPLSAEIRRPEPELADALTAAARAKAGRKEKQAIEGEFGSVQTVLDLVFTKPLERLRVTAKTRVQDLPRSVHPAKQLHIIAAAIAPHAGKRASKSLTDLAASADSGSYLFEDLMQFDDYCRWCFMQGREG
ncbi:hypothetical protein BAC2_00413 [uncultured bacterium]|nr:hypothetical protein BAC2_00413 [uncultured bacterium]